MSDEERLRTTTEVAKSLGVASRTITRYVERGWLVPDVRLPSGQFRFRWSSVRKQLGGTPEQP